MLMIGAGLLRIPQTVFYETQRRQYQAWIYGTGWVRKRERQAGPLRGAARIYLAVVALVSAGGERLDAQLAAADEDERARIRNAVSRHVLPLIRRLWLFSSNIRTLIIGAAMIASQPIAIVVFELVEQHRDIHRVEPEAEEAEALGAAHLGAKIGLELARFRALAGGVDPFRQRDDVVRVLVAPDRAVALVTLPWEPPGNAVGMDDAQASADQFARFLVGHAEGALDDPRQVMLDRAVVVEADDRKLLDSMSFARSRGVWPFLRGSI